ncbi:carbohydrate ABC transporter permease [Kineococcus indalonis]|uniref:carbohydrate ABC transporter permease n=1 Tax=Kineococcus indalonis TaxID=2696566 RepID=UPI0014134FD0|nr:carbohydrate ABC transporter permease [Kineococcus indalonis]NAZ84691.1 ABC transporter permease subunit [Kineococcus indalonis]
MSGTRSVTTTAAPGRSATGSGGFTGTRKGRARAKSGDIGKPAPLWVRTVLALLCLLWIVPVFGLAFTSLRDRVDATDTGWWSVFTSPSQLSRLTVENYSQVIAQADLGTALVNSLAITIPATIIPILIAAFAAYAFAFMEFWGRDVLLVLIVSLLVVPNQVALTPLLNIYGQLGVNGQFIAAWLAHIGFGMSLAVYLIRNYMATLPKEVIESAKIDGASHYQTFWKLIVPMSVPALASFAIFQFLWVWNDLLVALVFIGPGGNQPLTIALVSLLGQQGQGWQLVAAGGFFTMILPILVFLSLQRYFVRGLTAGSVKG